MLNANVYTIIVNVTCEITTFYFYYYFSFLPWVKVLCSYILNAGLLLEVCFWCLNSCMVLLLHAHHWLLRFYKVQDILCFCYCLRIAWTDWNQKLNILSNLQILSATLSRWNSSFSAAAAEQCVCVGESQNEIRYPLKCRDVSASSPVWLTGEFSYFTDI